MERYQFEIRFRLAAELKQSYSYIEMVRCLGNSGLQDIVLERVGFLNYKDTPLALRLPSDMRSLEAESIGHELIRSLGVGPSPFLRHTCPLGARESKRGRCPTGKAGADRARIHGLSGSPTINRGSTVARRFIVRVLNEKGDDRISINTQR